MAERRRAQIPRWTPSISDVGKLPQPLASRVNDHQSSPKGPDSTTPHKEEHRSRSRSPKFNTFDQSIPASNPRPNSSTRTHDPSRKPSEEPAFGLSVSKQSTDTSDRSFYITGYATDSATR
ncbi:hypothetical protein NHQ30_007573 [Ciborinia camelliae]|nr:hypothetical protein NHQ30_007573 [Ciborinia camelliae]